MKDKVLITGGTGKLGQALVSLLGSRCIAPTRQEMDITNKESVSLFIKKHSIGAVVHCAALVNMVECEKNPVEAFNVNVIGTAHVVQAINPGTRFVYISTDYVYPCTKGPYSERDAVIPVNTYAWTKLGGECAAHLTPNHCVVRTSFFDPLNIPYESAAIDGFCSKIPVSELARAIENIIGSSFIGTLNVGCDRASLYTILKKYKPSIKAKTLEEINKISPTKRAADSSLDVSLWRKISNNSSIVQA